MAELATDRCSVLSDRCRCRRIYSVVLVVTFGGDGVSCLKCNLHVSARRLKLDAVTTRSLRRWRDAETRLFAAWLLSGSKERWAAARMKDPASPLNRHARALARRVSNSLACWVNYFQDERSQELGRPRKCPRCRAVPATVATKVGRRRVCRRCRLTWWADDSTRTVVPNMRMQLTRPRERWSKAGRPSNASLQPIRGR